MIKVESRKLVTEVDFTGTTPMVYPITRQILSVQWSVQDEGPFLYWLSRKDKPVWCDARTAKATWAWTPEKGWQAFSHIHEFRSNDYAYMITGNVLKKDGTPGLTVRTNHDYFHTDSDG